METGYHQFVSQISRFDDSAVVERRRNEAAAVASAAETSAPSKGAQPGQDGVIYEPGHHAADYAGLVSRDALERAHFSGRDQEHVAYGDLGVAPAEGVPTSDHVAGSGRRHWGDDVRFKSREVVPGSAPLFADPTYYIQGGQSDRFESTAMAAQQSKPTSRSLLVHQGAPQGRKHVAPAFEPRHGHGTSSGAVPYLADMTNRTGPGGRIVAGGGQAPLGRDAYAAEAPLERGQLVRFCCCCVCAS